MRSRSPEGILVSLLRQCYSSSRYHHMRIGNTRNFQSYTHSRPAQLRRWHTSFYNSPKGIEPERYTSSFLLSQKAILSNQSRTLDPNHPKEIAVLGGGITGLASAYFLSNALPEARISIYESTDRLGGWLQTKHIDTKSGDVVFEQGPRTLRFTLPAGLVMLELVPRGSSLGDFILTPSTRLRVLVSRTSSSSRLKTP
jgi:oxygen-dependent protoporphyrinogen oxidase